MCQCRLYKRNYDNPIICKVFERLRESLIERSHILRCLTFLFHPPSMYIGGLSLTFIAVHYVYASPLACISNADGN
jgi:hypothetical protein